MVTYRPLLLALLIVVSMRFVTPRAVNISSVWLLPEEGFPVFYRYFRDRITWFEADAVCQFHHANLVTVDSSDQYDATRAYLKELDVVTNVWVGLKRSGSEGEFTWTDYKPLENGGYWQEQIPLTDNPVCAALDPSADFRWHPLSCGGPEVASFICQLEVPGWARKEDGCMVTSLPSLTVTYLPEQGAVELISDCGLEGTRRIACKGQANRDEMMKQLSCESSTEGQTEATSSNTWDNEMPTRHRRDTEVTVDMASAPTTQGLAEVNLTNTTEIGTPTAEAKRESSIEVKEDGSFIKTEKDKEEGITSTQILPQEMSAAEEPIKSSMDILTEKPLNNKSSVEPTQRIFSSPPPSVDKALFDDTPIEIPLNSIAKIASDETEQSQEEKQSGDKRQVVVPSKPIPPSLRGNSPFPMTTIAPGKNESAAQKPVEKESHEVFRESKADIKLPEKSEIKPVIIPSLTKFNVTSDRDPDESSARITQTDSPQQVKHDVEERLPETDQKIEKYQEKSESKFFSRVVADTTVTSVIEEHGPRSTHKPDTDNDFFIATENPLISSETPTKLTSTTLLETVKKSTDSATPEDDLPKPADQEMADEAAPEAPERPNRGRLLIRPQHHSFYPYFLNRVLG